jgi:hypothetical protein
MSSAKNTTALPIEVRAVQRKFHKWRTTRPRLSRIPDSLWEAAISLHPRHSLSKIAHILHLECAVLRQHLPSSLKTTGKPEKRAQRFVEMTPSVVPLVSEYLVEVEDARARVVRVRLPCSRGGIEGVVELVRRLRQETA